MSTQLLFYSQAKPVNLTEHRDLCIKAGTDFSFARAVSAVPLTAAEFSRAAPEYAIVFTGSDQTVTPVVILGAQKDQNLYLNEDGTWRASYVPAFVRRYPFVFAQGQDANTLTLCVDEQFSGCNREGRGEHLFDSDGQRTAYLEQVLKFLRSYQVEHRRTQDFCKRLVELDLLQPVQANLSPASGERRVLSGLRVVNRAKLKELDAATIHRLLTSDELELIYLQLHSLPNIRILGERMPREPAEDTAPPADPGADEALGPDATKH
jgi:hypothetical protein